MPSKQLRAEHQKGLVTYRVLKRGLPSQSTGLAATMLGTRALRTDGLQRSRQTAGFPHWFPDQGVSGMGQVRKVGDSLWGWIPPDIEAVVGVRSVLSPLEQRPLKLDGDLGDRVGRELDQHLQEVGLLPVLGRLIVDVTWRQTKVHPSLAPGVRLTTHACPYHLT